MPISSSRKIVFLDSDTQDSVSAAVEEQYLPTASRPVYHMESFYNLEAEPDRELFKLPIQDYVICTGRIV